MKFHDALIEVILNKRMVRRKIFQFEDDHFKSKNEGSDPIPWSVWMRIRLDDDSVDYDALVYFETRNRDDSPPKWHNTWTEDQVSRADILADDWEFTTEEECN